MQTVVAGPTTFLLRPGAARPSRTFLLPPKATSTTNNHRNQLFCCKTGDTTGETRVYGRRCRRLDGDFTVAGRETGVEDQREQGERKEVFLNSVAPLPLLFLAALPGAEAIKSLFAPFVEIVKSLSLPDWLVHWGHPGNMAVVLFAMGGYGTYLGFRIRFSDDAEEKAKAKDLHPKLLAGMFFFFALGATGGITSLLTSDKPILESPHAVTGITGLTLLTIQSILPTLFEGNPGLRNVHGILGSSIMALFLVHAVFGLQLGLSY